MKEGRDQIGGVRMRKATLNQSVLDAVNDALAERKITYTAVAKKMGASRSNISRALRGAHAITLNHLERICKAAGLQVEVTIKDAE